MPIKFFRERKSYLSCLRRALLFIAMFSAPIFAFAASPVALSGPLADLKTKIVTIFNLGAAILIGLAFVVFLWGIYKYVTTASLDGKAGAKETIIYGLIGLFVMLSAWGLVNILLGTFGFTATNSALNPGKIPKAF